MNGKCIREPDVRPQQLLEKEFTELSVDVARFPEQNMRYKTITARHVAESALLLLNHPFAIKEQPTLQPTSNKFKWLQSMPRTGEYNVQLTQILYLATVPATNLITFVSIPLQSLS